MSLLQAEVGAAERGVAVVEAAIITPVVVGVIVALVVTSVLWRDQLAATDAAAAGARAAGLHPGPLVHPEALGPATPGRGTPAVVAAVAAALAGVPPGAVERVVVFGTGSGGPEAAERVPTGCRRGVGPAPGERCVVLGAADLGRPAGVASCGPGECVWRDGPGIEQVGVFVRLRHPHRIAGVVPSPSIEAAVIVPLEGATRG